MGSNPFTIPSWTSHSGTIKFDTTNFEKLKIGSVKCTSTQSGKLMVNGSGIKSYPNVNGNGASQTITLNYELDLTNVNSVTINNSPSYGWTSSQWVVVNNIVFE